MLGARCAEKEVMARAILGKGRKSRRFGGYPSGAKKGERRSGSGQALHQKGAWPRKKRLRNRLALTP